MSVSGANGGRSGQQSSSYNSSMIHSANNASGGQSQSLSKNSSNQKVNGAGGMVLVEYKDEAENSESPVK